MLEFIVDKLIALLGPITTLSKDKRELKDNALRAISIALQETKIYYRNVDLNKKRDRDVEAQLAKYWAAAAIPLRHIDEDLAARCEDKAEYWIHPEDWSDKRVEKFRIKLEDVSQAYRRLAMPKSYRANGYLNK